MMSVQVPMDEVKFMDEIKHIREVLNDIAEIQVRMYNIAISFILKGDKEEFTASTNDVMDDFQRLHNKIGGLIIEVTQQK